MNRERDKVTHDLSRRSFLGLLAGLLAVFAGATWFFRRSKSIYAEFSGPNHKRGHQLRETYTPRDAGITRRIDTAIIGGGISGLSAAWYLQKYAKREFRLFELEDRAAGNAQWGENRLGRFPWGAHYLPTPGADAHWVREILAEMGIFRNGRYSEEALVHEAEERLYIYGNWQPGLIPLMGAREEDRRQIGLFFETMAGLRNARGKDGRRAFTIPLELSSADDAYRRYDRQTAALYLSQMGITSRRLLWYIDYVLRDEYGSNRQNTSAWALLHYFAARSESHNLVWPEGNGFIAEYLRGRVAGAVQESTSLRLIEKQAGRYKLIFQNFKTGTEEQYVADHIIFAAPKFVLPYVYPDLAAARKNAVREFVYSPWLTVNLLVNHFAETDPAWDNVFFGSPSLGYVIAEHQKSGKLPHARTLTFFHAFDQDDTLTSRRQLLQMSEQDALGMAMAEITRAHPQVKSLTEHAGIYRWAHAMIRPRPGFVWGSAREAFAEIDRNFYGAHSDISGMSNFEQAQYRGILAAQAVAGHHG